MTSASHGIYNRLMSLKRFKYTLEQLVPLPVGLSFKMANLNLKRYKSQVLI
jgi:hypothetical protein